MKNLFAQFASVVVFILATGCNSSPETSHIPPQNLLLTAAETTLYHPRSAFKTAESPVSPPIVNGTSYYAVNTTQVTYEYDQLHRLTKRTGADIEYTGAPLAHYSEIDYAYSEGKVQRTSLMLAPVTLHLNTHGYVVENNTYDEEGYLIRSEDAYAITKRTIKNGNCIQRIYETNNQLITTTFDYDLTQAGLPDPLSIESGKPNRNLLVKSTQHIQWKSGSMSGQTDKIVTTFEYVHNSKGMIDQRTALIDAYHTDDPQVVNRHITITRFSYTGFAIKNSL